METTQVIETLRKEAKSDKFVESICTVLAVKPRSRFTLTVDALNQRMTKEGFDFDHERAVRFLSLLARLGFGRLQKSGGKVVALTEIRTTLQSIGKAAMGEAVNLDKFQKRNRYTKLAHVPRAAMAAQTAPAPIKPKTLLRSIPPKAPPVSVIGLAVSLNGRTVRLPIGDDMTVEDIAALAQRFREPKRA